MQERVTALRSSERLWNSKNNQLPRSTADLIKKYSDRTATSLKFYAFVAYQAYVVWLDFTENETTYKTDNEYTFLRALQVGVDRQGVKDGKPGENESVSL